MVELSCITTFDFQTDGTIPDNVVIPYGYRPYYRGIRFPVILRSGSEYTCCKGFLTIDGVLTFDSVSYSWREVHFVLSYITNDDYPS